MFVLRIPGITLLVRDIRVHTVPLPAFCILRLYYFMLRYYYCILLVANID